MRTPGFTASPGNHESTSTNPFYLSPDAPPVDIWVNGAVGIIGDEGNAANLMYAGVLAAALVGSAASRFRAEGMARAMFATADAQVLVGAIALAAGLGRSGPAWPMDVLVLTALFTAMWLGSALLFRKARSTE